MENPTRRRFHIGAILSLWGAICAALGIPTLAYLLVPGEPTKEDDWVELGGTAQLQPNVPVEMTFHRSRKDGWKVASEKSTAWVVKLPGGSIAAYGPQCTHLGCAYHWDEGQRAFVCPCHTSLFAIDGKVTGGPAPRPLDRFDVKVANNKLLIGKLRETKA